MKAMWKIMREGACEEALLAVDLYNQPRQTRRLEGYLVHMHIAWTYLLQAEFKRDGTDNRYRLPNGRLDRIDGEPKTWDLARSVAERWPNSGAVRKNLELTIGLRNKVEHRFHEATLIATSGYAQSLLLNFEEELISEFGAPCSLGEQLRFPIFVGSITALGNTRLDELQAKLPASTRDFLAHFESGLSPAVAKSQQFEFRINLVPKTSPKIGADRALTFIRASDLSPEQLTNLETLGRSGTVVVREQIRQVVNVDLLNPTAVVNAVQKRIRYKFNMWHFTQSWKALGGACQPF
jgi:Protein of unknown function (DUF3644)